MKCAVGTTPTLAHTLTEGYAEVSLPFRLTSLARGATVLAGVLACSSLARAAKIACVGDSITFGYGLGNPNSESYPAQLAARLGAAHTVENFGVSGATLLKQGDKPYWNEASFTSSGTFTPDVVVVMLGTNDAKPQNWSYSAAFSANYAELIEHYRALGALVYVATPPPVYAPGAYDIPPDVVANQVVPLVRTVAGDANAPLVDVFTALSGKPEDFPDTVHPNNAGAGLIADAVKAALDAHGFGGASGAAGSGGASQGGRSNGDAGFGGSAAPPGGAFGTSGGAGSAGNTVSLGGASSDGGRANGNGGTTSGGTPSSNAGAPSASGAGGAGGRGGTNGSSAGASNVAGTSASSAGRAGAGASGNGSAIPPSPAGSSADDGGCGCKVSGSTASRQPLGFAALGAALALALRRRRSARQ
jgi:acyl-CoA thioesterase I